MVKILFAISMAITVLGVVTTALIIADCMFCAVRNRSLDYASERAELWISRLDKVGEMMKGRRW